MLKSDKMTELSVISSADFLRRTASKISDDRLRAKTPVNISFIIDGQVLDTSDDPFLTAIIRSELARLEFKKAKGVEAQVQFKPNGAYSNSLVRINYEWGMYFSGNGFGKSYEDGLIIALNQAYLKMQSGDQLEVHGYGHGV